MLFDLSDFDASVVTGGLSKVGENASTFSFASNNAGGNNDRARVMRFPGFPSRWTVLPNNDLARQKSSFANARAAFASLDGDS